MFASGTAVSSAPFTSPAYPSAVPKSVSSVTSGRVTGMDERHRADGYGACPAELVAAVPSPEW